MPTEQTVVDIKRDLNSGNMTSTQIAIKHNVSRHTVSRIANGKAFRNVIVDDKDRENRILQLEAELSIMTSERNMLQREARSQTMDQGFFHSMVDQLKQSVPALKPPDRIVQPAKSGMDTTEHLVLHLSDGHHDQVIKPECVGGIESHDFNVSCVRAENLIDQVAHWRNVYSNAYQFQTIWVLAYGDHTSGELHGHVDRSHFRNQFHNTLAIGQLHALMIRDLYSMFDNVNVVYLPGNHGRRTRKKEFTGAQNNWDFLVGKVAELHCSDMDVNFLIPNSFSLNLDINGSGFHIHHGDDIQSTAGMPFYGIAKRARSLAMIDHTTNLPRLRYHVCGHHHRPASLAEGDCEYLVNGPWVATDEYSYNSFNSFTEPQQLLHNVNSNGISWRHSLKHRDFVREAKGPKRYKVTL